MNELTILYLPAVGEQTARVRVSYKPETGEQTEERETEFHFALTDVDRGLIRWYREEYLFSPEGEARDRAADAEALMTRTGQALFRAVFSDAETASLYGLVAGNLSNTRIVVVADDPAAIALPWEMMRDPDRGAAGDLALRTHSFVRSRPNLNSMSPAKSETFPPGDTLNILLVMPQPLDRDDGSYSAARSLLEWSRQRSDIRIDVLRPPTFEQLASILAKQPNFYHVLHFDGDADQDSRFLFEDEDGATSAVMARELGSLLAKRGVPTAVLNGCRPGLPESAFSVAGSQMLASGMSGVVAISCSARDSSTLPFILRLYTELANGEELATAAAMGREELRVRPERPSLKGKIAVQDWMTPVLWEAAPSRLRDPSPTSLQTVKSVPSTEVDCPGTPLYGFIGRDDIQSALERAFRHETIVLLEGAAGIGKTEAAMEFARRQALIGALDGPILFCPFDRLTVTHVCDQVGAAFGQEVRSLLGEAWRQMTTEEQRLAAVHILRLIPCLLIWDHFEPAELFPDAEAAEADDTKRRPLRQLLTDLRGGRTHVLLTSRRNEPWLGSIYRRVPIGGLRLEEAKELASRVLADSGMDPRRMERLPEYDALLTHLEGNPLAIQAILPELNSKRPDRLLYDLRAPETLRSEDAPAAKRPPSMSVLTYLLDGLDEGLRARLGLLVLFRGYVDPDVLAMLSQQEGAPDLIRGWSSEAWASDLRVAAGWGLAQSHRVGGFVLHSAVSLLFRDTFRTTLSLCGDGMEESFAQVYSDYSKFLVMMGSTKAGLSHDLFRLEESNLKRALRIAYHEEQWDVAGCLLLNLVNILRRQDRGAEREQLIQQGKAYEKIRQRQQPLVETDAGPPSEPSITARLRDVEERLVTRGLTVREAGVASEEPKGDIGTALEGMETIHDDGAALLQMGDAAAERFEWDTAEQWYRQAYTVEGRKRDETGQALAAEKLGGVALTRWKLDEATTWHQLSLRLMQKLGNEHGQAEALHQLSIVAQRRRELPEAEALLRQSLAFRERLGYEQAKAATLIQLGSVVTDRKEFDMAESMLHKGLEIVERMSDEAGQATAQRGLAKLALARRRYGEADHWLRQSLVIDERLGNLQGQSSDLHELGTVSFKRGFYVDAEKYYKRSLSIKERIGDRHSQAITQHQLGLIAEERGEVAEAIYRFKSAEALFLPFNDATRLQVVQNSLARMRAS